MSEQELQQQEQEISDDEAIMKIAQAMKDNAPSSDEKQNVHTFLTNVIQVEDINQTSKVGNLRQDKEIDELGIPTWNVRGSLDMVTISDKLMDNGFFKDYFQENARQSLNTSLSREGFMIRSAVTQTKQVADITKRRKTNKGWFGSKKVTEETGGDPYSNKE